MNTRALENPIVRQVTIEKDGKQVQGEIRVGPLEEADGGRVCRFSISYVVHHGSLSRGVDALDALERCLKSVRTLIEGYQEDRLGMIWWLEKGDCGGFGAPAREGGEN